MGDRPFGSEVVPLPGPSVGCNLGMPVSVAVRAYIRTPEAHDEARWIDMAI